MVVDNQELLADVQNAAHMSLVWLEGDGEGIYVQDGTLQVHNVQELVHMVLENVHMVWVLVHMV